MCWIHHAPELGDQCVHIIEGRAAQVEAVTRKVRRPAHRCRTAGQGCGYVADDLERHTKARGTGQAERHDQRSFHGTHHSNLHDPFAHIQSAQLRVGKVEAGDLILAGQRNAGCD